MGTAYQTMEIPILGANVTDKNIRINRFARLAMVNIFMSPAPLRRPSTAILKPIRQKKEPMKVR